VRKTIDSNDPDDEPSPCGTCLRQCIETVIADVEQAFSTGPMGSRHGPDFTRSA
jgi:hypothetical protein